MANLLIKFVFLAVLCLFFSSCLEVKDIEFVRVRKLEFKEIRDGKIIANADAVFNNPNKRGGKVKKVDISIFVNEKEAAKVMRNSPFKVSPNSEFTIPLEMEITFEELAKNFLSNIFSREKEKNLPLHFEGYIWVSVYGVTRKILVKYDASLKLRF